jgi:hypothetical protein
MRTTGAIARHTDVDFEMDTACEGRLYKNENSRFQPTEVTFPTPDVEEHVVDLGNKGEADQEVKSCIRKVRSRITESRIKKGDNVVSKFVSLVPEINICTTSSGIQRKDLQSPIATARNFKFTDVVSAERNAEFNYVNSRQIRQDPFLSIGLALQF